MKKFAKLSVFVLSALFAVAFAGCGSSTITSTPNQGVEQGVAESVGDYSKMVYYETDNPTDVKVSVDTDDIQKVSFKYRTLGNKEYSFKNGTLTVEKSVFENETAGDKRLRIFVGDKFFEVIVRVVSKVIYTVQDFNSIRTNLNGTYVLGADIDFGGAEFRPIGKPLSEPKKEGEDPDIGVFEGTFDGMGHSIMNMKINAWDRADGEDRVNQGPSLGSAEDNSLNASNGIFMSTGGSAQISNTCFLNITIEGRWLFGAVVGSNGGLVKNCYVTTKLITHGDNYANRAGGIVGINGSGDSAGRIENCICIYEQGDGATVRGIADWNNGIIKNCYAAIKDSYVFHLGYDHELGKVPDSFDYDDFVTQDNWRDCLGWNNLPAFPGALAWDNEKQTHIYYKGGDIINSDIVRKEYLCNPDNFKEENGWDRSVWSFVYGGYPTLKIQSR